MTTEALDVFVPDWVDIGIDPQAVDRMQFIGRYRAARRAIDAPHIEMTPVSRAVRYEIVISPLTQPDLILCASCDTPIVDLTPVWSRLPLGSLQYVGRAFDTAGTLCGITALQSIIKAPDWVDYAPEAADYLKAGQGVLRFLCDGVPDAPQHPGDPAYMWHAAIHPSSTEVASNLQHPALCYPAFIQFFLTADRLGLRDDLIGRATRLADFLIDHPMASEGPLEGIPMSTMDHDGSGGLYEKDRTTLVRIGWTGRTMLELFAVTGNERYEIYAHRLAEILLQTQAEDGSWPYRVRITDGEVVEEYTAAGIMPLLLFEHLVTGEPDDPYQAAIDRGLAWVLANPLKTGLWQQMYEDVQTLEPYENLEQWAALETAMFVLRHKHPDAVAIASRLARYIEDQFVIFGDEASLPVPYLPHTPSVLEQYRCYWPMDAHTSNYARMTLALYDATGDPVWAHKAVAAGNTITECQRPDGRFSTLVPDRRFGVFPRFTDWFNCMSMAADTLLIYGPRLTELAGKEAC